jgi:outer membrane lipoprotein-sorting protein
MRFVLVPLIWIALALPAAADKIALADLSRYLNALQTAQAQFTQINEDGTIDTGRILIKRPGRVRFEYDPPNGALVLASGGEVAVFDPKSNEGPTSYPLARTPLSIILEEKVDLGRAKMVTAHREEGLATVVRAQDPEHPEYGYIELVFTGPSVELRQWVITNDSGSKTTVILGELTKGGALPNSLFSIGNNMPGASGTPSR